MRQRIFLHSFLLFSFGFVFIFAFLISTPSLAACDFNPASLSVCYNSRVPQGSCYNGNWRIGGTIYNIGDVAGAGSYWVNNGGDFLINRQIINIDPGGRLDTSDTVTATICMNLVYSAECSRDPTYYDLASPLVANIPPCPGVPPPNPTVSNYSVCYNSIQFFTRSGEACVSGNFRMRFRLTNNSSQNIPVTRLTTLNQTHNNYPFYQYRSDWYDTVNIPASGSISRDITGLIESCGTTPLNDVVAATNKLVEDDYTIHIGDINYRTVPPCFVPTPTPTPATAIVSGVVFADCNQNGTKGAGEGVVDVENVCPGGTWATSVTLTGPGISGTFGDSSIFNGGYSTSSVPQPGQNYTVKLNLAAGCAWTPTNNNQTIRVPVGGVTHNLGVYNNLFCNPPTPTPTSTPTPTPIPTPTCAPTDPDPPQLFSPSYGEFLPVAEATLKWLAVASWGEDCLPGSNKRYKVYLTDDLSLAQDGDLSYDGGTLVCNVAESILECDQENLNDNTSYYWQVEANNGSRQRPSALGLFNIRTIAFSWFQTKDGDVHAGTDITSTIPSFVDDKYLSLEGAGGFPGVVSYGSSFSLGEGTISTTNWQAKTAYKGPDIDFETLKNRFKVNTGSDTFSGTMPAISGTYYSSTAQDLTGSFPVGRKIIIFVDGNVTVNDNIVVPEGDFFALVSSGNIVFKDTVTAAEGFFLADGTISDSVGNSQFVGSGSFIGKTGVSMQRDLGGDNNTIPAEYFIGRPDLYLNAPSSFLYTPSFFQEVAP